MLLLVYLHLSKMNSIGKSGPCTVICYTSTGKSELILINTSPTSKFIRIGSLSKEVSADLVPQFGPIFKERQLSGMMKLAKVVQDPEHVSGNWRIYCKLVAYFNSVIIKAMGYDAFFRLQSGRTQLTIRQLRKEIRTEVLKRPFATEEDSAR